MYMYEIYSIQYECIKLCIYTKETKFIMYIIYTIHFGFGHYYNKVGGSVKWI